jgi:small subunit ribosomal protein S3
MGQKVNPTAYRLGTIFSWKSRWYANKHNYADLLQEDQQIRTFLQDNLSHAGLDEIEIERSLATLKIILHVSRPGVVIGKGGSNLKQIKKKLEQIVEHTNQSGQKKKMRINIRVRELEEPELSAKLIAETLAGQLIGRYPHRRAISQALDKVMSAGAEGVKIQLSGRIGGTEIGRTEKYFEGSVPTQTLRANIDYYEAPARTRSGYVGIKVWIYKGEVIEN